MFLFTILLVMLVILTILSVLVIGATGAVGVVIFGDVIICVWLIVKIMKWLTKKKK